MNNYFPSPLKWKCKDKTNYYGNYSSRSSYLGESVYSLPSPKNAQNTFFAFAISLSLSRAPSVVLSVVPSVAPSLMLVLFESRESRQKTKDAEIEKEESKYLRQKINSSFSQFIRPLFRRRCCPLPWCAPAMSMNPTLLKEGQSQERERERKKGQKCCHK